MTEEAHRQHYNVTFALLALAAISYALLQSLVAPALPDIQHALDTSVNSVSWVLTAYLLSASIATPLIGRLGDMYGKERLLVVRAGRCCAVATVVCALAHTPRRDARRARRAGRGGRHLPAGVRHHPRRVPARAGRRSGRDHVGARSASAAGWASCSPVRSSTTSPTTGCSGCRCVPLVVATVAIHLFVPESPIRVAGKVNWTGAALMSLGLGLVLIAVSETPTWGWLSAKTVGLFAAGAVLLVLWVRSETRSTQPLVDMRMMRIRGVWTTNAVALLLGFGMYASFILMPQYVETPSSAGYGFGASVTGAGLFLVPSTLAMLVIGRPDGPAREAVRLEAAAARRARWSPPARTSLLAVARDERWEIYVAALLLGAGIGLAFASMVNLIIENVGPEETGIATGMNTVTRTVGGAFGGAIVASILAESVGALGFPSSEGFTLAFVVCAIALLMGFVVGLAIPQRRPEDAFATSQELPATSG